MPRPWKVLKVKKWLGIWDASTVTTQNLEIIKTDSENGYIFVKGSVPGSKGGWVILNDAKKIPLRDDLPLPAGIKGHDLNEETPAEEAPAEETPAEEAPAEEAPEKKLQQKKLQQNLQQKRLKMKVNLINIETEKTSSEDLQDEFFGLDPRKDILHRVVTWQLSRKRLGTRKTKK